MCAVLPNNLNTIPQGHENLRPKFYLAMKEVVMEMNYKVIFDALSCNQRFSNKKRNCLFCENIIESRKHVFLECPFSKLMFDIVRSRMDEVDCEINAVNIYFGD
jgi:hypothetical protein